VSAESAFMVVRGVRLRRDPAREPCFTVVHSDAEMQDWPDMSEMARRERLHRHMNNEVGSLEIAAQMLVDFPEAPWELRLQLARQCWDETRHTQMLYKRLRELGGRKGEFPVMNYEWGVVCLMESLEGRVALQNRTFEAGEMDLFRQLIKTWTEAGDLETAEMLDTLLADEVAHVRFGNRWLKRITQGNPRAVMKIAQAMAHLRAVSGALAPTAGEKNAAGVDLTAWTHLEHNTNVEDRELAEFDRDEIAELLRRESALSAGAAPDAAGAD